jgi:hypothetical protein
VTCRALAHIKQDAAEFPNEALPAATNRPLVGAARHGQEMSPVEPQGSCDVGKSIQRKFGKSGGVGQCIRKLPAEFVLELLERCLVEAHTKGCGQVRERHDRVVGSEHATEIDRTYGHLLPDSTERARLALDAFVSGARPAEEAQDGH